MLKRFRKKTKKQGKKRINYLQKVQEVYVAKNGSNDTGDGSKENPFATAQKGVNTVVNEGTIYLEINGGLGEFEVKNKIIFFKSWKK